MEIKGEILLGATSIKTTENSFYAQNPTTGQQIEPAFSTASIDLASKACFLAGQSFDQYRSTSLEKRAVFLETIADEILALGDTLVERAMAESGLPQMRIEGERGRTMGQLKLFASVVRAGNFLDARIDPAMPDRAPMPRCDIRLRNIPLGPVVVFGASNFPLAFSVAGGDTASALAAGCPVVCKAHSAHPGTSELMGRAIQNAVKKCGMPENTFSLIFTNDRKVGSSLVTHPAIKAVGFTGSRAGGLALMNLAANRAEPIPVYAEMSSINPVFLLPNKLDAQSEHLAEGFVASLTMGAGQFCTNPGLVIGLKGDALNNFITTVKTKIVEAVPQTMLTKGIYEAYVEGQQQLSTNTNVIEVAAGKSDDEPNKGQASVYRTSATQFMDDKKLQDEIFGATALILECESIEEYIHIAEHIEGQLTATMQLNDTDIPFAQKLLTVLERKAGRVLCNGYPTGVEVCHAMVHGGPFPSTSDSKTTSVGSGAIMRFLRPVSYQDMPVELLPSELTDANPLNVKQLIDGKY